MGCTHLRVSKDDEARSMAGLSSSGMCSGQLPVRITNSTGDDSQAAAPQARISRLTPMQKFRK
ncbi:hypothetical protein AU162_gp041 [Pseudomonas phage YMC11/02/R656]|uniref:Uncharacterized protein n=1 Tax=Pseudomonas phage YMC11/02/R656 TaxID=1755689 RepID=A0A0S2SY89_9CAUD|nr:hypothetical protein AU162_gp041 [Pseudomonas phage YMC11/02/R656]ALP47862.1 hypothetical protein BPPAER656_00400 [Pseudomonas phage YMC11/02/R656]